MNLIQTTIPDLIILEPNIFSDDRGFFYESFNHAEFNKLLGLAVNFYQDNQSFSKKNVIRGLHAQNAPYGQGKLVSVIVGEIFDVAVDIRRDSITFGKVFSVCLSSDNKKSLWIPEGFLHGFQVLSDFANVFYKTTNYYNPSSELTVNPLDNDLKIDWPSSNNFIISDKDKKGINFHEIL